MPQRTPSTTWTSLRDLSGHDKVVGQLHAVPVPDTSRVCFLDARSESPSKLLKALSIDCLSIQGILTDFIIPLWEDGLLNNWSLSCKEKVTELLLQNFGNLGSENQTRLKSLNFIPNRCVDGQYVGSFSTAARLIDPISKDLLDLFYKSEEVCPAAWLFPDYRGILIQLGMKQFLDEDLVRDRVGSYAKKGHAFEATLERASKLLQLMPTWASCAETSRMSIIKELPWLPAVKNETKSLELAKNCRGLNDRLLVGLVLPIVNVPISNDWQRLLGWEDEIIQDFILISQLEQGIEINNRKIVDAVLNYIDQKKRTDSLCDMLSTMTCILTSRGDFTSMKKAFRSGCEVLYPYLFNVDSGFWQEHRSLLERVGVQERPTLQTLLEIQRQFNPDEILQKRDMEVVVEIIKYLASNFGRSELSSLRIPNNEGKLSAIGDVTFDNMGGLSSFNSTHPDLPVATIKQLKIENASDRQRRKELGLADFGDHDEFNQGERAEDRISDTLNRYSVASTFKEYLANADDAGTAQQINWLLDERQHPKVRLMTYELRDYQGPALLVHNDGSKWDIDSSIFVD